MLSEGHGWHRRLDQSSNFWWFVIAGFAGKSSRIRLRQSSWNGVGRVWDTSKYPPKPFVNLCQIKVFQGHQVKRSNLVIWFRFCDRTFLGDISVKNAKNDSITFLTDQTDQSLRIGKNTDISEIAQKWPFYIQNGKTCCFSRYWLEISYTYSSTSILSHTLFNFYLYIVFMSSCISSFFCSKIACVIVG